MLDRLLRLFKRRELRPVSEEEKRANKQFKRPRHLFCRCRDCDGWAYCHGLCKAHRNEKRSLGYSC